MTRPRTVARAWGGGDLDVAVAGVLGAPGGDGGIGEDGCPGEQLGGVVDGGGDVADDVELAADAQQNGELTGVLRGVDIGGP